MVHDDLRVEWIRQRVSAGFNLRKCPDCFDELLSRRDGEEEEKIIRYLNFVSEEDSPSCLLFFKTVREEEREVEVPVGKSWCLCPHYGYQSPAGQKAQCL